MRVTRKELCKYIPNRIGELTKRLMNSYSDLNVTFIVVYNLRKQFWATEDIRQMVSDYRGNENAPHMNCSARFPDLNSLVGDALGRAIASMSPFENHFSAKNCLSVKVASTVVGTFRVPPV
ncbi:hypothetical protein TNCV_4376771 [Trichonephila clavipes]|nr:hypothetical protein TNCV_4376771 [Trichonephila clavipes]